MSFVSPKRLVIASRESRLAMWQAQFVQQKLKQLYPSCQVDILGMTTKGDQILDKSLSKIGGKGLFVKELQTALLDGRADLAVHSLKDVPVEPQPLFSLAAIMERADFRDAFVANDYNALADLPPGSVVGTSSLRRESQLRARYPHLMIKPLRGNLDTRLAKLDNKDYDAIILAAAGLERLGLKHRIRQYLSIDECLPAAGQGALGIEIAVARKDMVDCLLPLHDPITAAMIGAERYVSQALGGSCQVPIAAHASRIDEQRFLLQALVASTDGKRIIRSSSEGSLQSPLDLANYVSQSLLDQGAAALLKPADAQ